MVQPEVSAIQPTGNKKRLNAVTIKAQEFVLDCSKPVNDAIFDMASFEKFLHDKIKVNGQTGKFGDYIKLTRNGSSIQVNTNNLAFSKRYLKYLCKKYLKKNTLRDWLRVIATDKNTYQLRYFNIDEEEEKAESETDE